MKIAIIGGGNIGGAVALGLARGGAVEKADLTVTAPSEKTRRRFLDAGLCATADNAAAVQAADMVLIAVKPWIFPDVAREVAQACARDGRRRLIVSVSPAVKADDLRAYFTPEGASEPAQPLCYLIPNTAVEVGKGMSFVVDVCAGPADCAALEALMRSTGDCLQMPPHLLVAATSVSSCGIAYALEYLRASLEGARQLGLEPGCALRLLCHTVEGAAALLLERGQSPEEEISRVTTPGGMTLRGLDAMARAGFAQAVVDGLKAQKKE